MKKNQYQLCWLMQKTRRKANNGSTQKFLDTQQYRWKNILRYERVFGRGFISTGGVESTKVVCLLFSLRNDFTLVCSVCVLAMETCILKLKTLKERNAEGA